MKKIKKIFLFGLLTVVLGTTGVFITSCGEKEAEISISPSTTETTPIYVGETAVLSFKVENYSSNGEIFVSSYDENGYSSGNNTSSKISYTTEYKGSGVTEVTVKGLEGGTATIVGKTQEGGNKTAQMLISVKKYSSILEQKENNLFVSSNTDLIPSDNMFVFSDNTTEKRLTYYFVENKDKIAKNAELSYGSTDTKKKIKQSGTSEELVCSEFTKCELSEDKTKLIFTQSEADTSGNNKTFSVDITSSGDAFVNYFVAEYVNSSMQTIYQLVSFNTFLGIDGTKFTITDNESNVMNTMHLVSYSSNNNSTKEVCVTVPYSDADKYAFDYTLSDEDKNKVSVLLKETVTNETDNTLTYKYEFQTKVARKDEIEVSFNLYYKDFFGVDDETVSISKKLKVNLQVQPNSMKVNDLVETDEQNQYDLYNYNVGDYGWRELNIAVYAEDSTYSYVEITFDEALVEVKQGNIQLENGYRITDLSNPIRVRGKENAEVGTDKEIKFEVKTPYEMTNPLVYTVKFSIKTGAKNIEFTDDDYKYATDTIENQNCGVYLSLSNGVKTFEGIRADNVFGNATVTSKENTNIAKVEYIDNTSGLVSLKITPIQKGTEWFNILTDNGLSLNFLVRVVNTFEDLKVEKYGENAGVYNFSSEDISGGKKINLIAKTESNLSFKIFDTNEAIVSIEEPNNLGSLTNSISFEDINIVKIKTSGSAGEGNGSFIVKGNIVNNFKLTETSKVVNLSLNTYTLVSDFNIYTDNTKATSASNVTLYSSENTQDMSKISFYPEVKESNAYCFKFNEDYNTINIQKAFFSSKYIYWTLGESIYKIYEQGDSVEKSKMIYGSAGKQYEIRKGSDGSKVAEFDTSDLTFTVSNTFTGKIVLFALIEQYGYINSFAINITVEPYVEIKSLNVSLNENINFTKTEKETQIAVTTPDLDATNLKIVCLVETPEGKSSLIEEPTITSVKDGRWMISLKLKSDVVENESNYAKTIIKICAKDWVDSINQIKSDRQYKRYEITYSSGTVDNPYLLTTAQDVINIGKNEMLSSHYRLINDIDISAFSNQLPLGDFSGSIVCENNSKISGIEIKQGNEISGAVYYGLFTKLTNTAKIEGVTFEGSINCSINNTANTYIGLLAGESEGTITNVSIVLNESIIELKGTAATYVGAMFGNNNGEITKNGSTLIPVITNDKMTIRVSNSSGCTVYAGGIAGHNTNIIKDETTGYSENLTGYQAYLSYAEISVVSYDTNLTVKSGTVYLGAISGYDTNEISGVEGKTVIGGRLYTNISNSYVGGVSGALDGTDVNVSNLKIRTFVKGYNVGGITASAGINADKISNICLQAIDDGESVGEDASMIVKYGLSSNWSSLDTNVKKINYIATGQLGWTKTDITAENYVTRTLKNEGSVTDLVTYYHGNYFEYSSNEVNNSYTFGSEDIDATTVTKKAGSIELISSDTTKMYTMYYFEAAGYYDSESTYKTENIYSVQEILDKNFNTVLKTSNLYPFQLGNGEFTIESDSSILSIDNIGNITLNGTGVAKIKIYNSLNLRNPVEVYIYVINYFNYAGLFNGSDLNKSLFSIDGNNLGSNVAVNMVADKNIVVEISPYFATNKDYFELEDSENCTGIDSDGLVGINNLRISLVKGTDIKANIDVNDSNFENNASCEISTNTVTISKKVQSTEEKDVIILKNNLSVNVDGKSYKTETEDVFFDVTMTINYKLGTTKVKNLYDSYVINTNSSQKDTVTLETDDSTDELNWTITKTVDGKVVYTQIKGEESLFTVDTSGSNPYTISLKVNKESDDYANRYTKDIFGDYIIRYTGKTNGTTVYKDVKITLDDRNLDSVVVENYPDYEERKESDKIVPSKYGMLSITLAPIDVDFYSIVIENIDNNYNTGFTSGFFILYQDVNCVNRIDCTTTEKGISFTQKALKESFGANYNGQFFIKYLFGNSNALTDGKNIGISFKMLKENGDEIYSDILNYTVNKKFELDVIVNGKTKVSDKYLLAKGLTYELEIKNTGYNSSSLNVSSSNTSIASIEKINGKYYLNVTSTNINYTNKSNEIKLIVSGQRTDEYGKEYNESSYVDCVVMEYVLNYSPTYENPEYDIIEGYEDGVIVSSLTKEHQLSLNLTNYLEYDHSNKLVIDEIKTFISSMNEQNTVWKIYTKLDDSDYNWDNIINGNINSSVIKTTTLTTTGSFENDYVKFSGLTYTLTRRHDPSENQMYMFKYSAKYKINTEQGIYEYDGSGTNTLTSYFTLMTYTLGSEDSPIPVTDYTDLKNMKSECYYILTNDIEITSETYKPINSSFAYLDGNNKTITFTNGTYDISKYSQAGVFEEIGSDTIVKNLKVVFETNVVFNYNYDDTLVFGAVAAENEGAITNANVSGNFKLVNTSSATGSVAGIVGTNSGKVTNSQATVSITVNGTSLSGVVSKNSGVVASSYYKGGKLINSSSKDTKYTTSGLVETNTEVGKILTSYTSGVVGSEIYCEVSNKNTAPSLINSNVTAAGFIHSNSGIISDCYSNIPIYSESYISGFVYINSGKVSNCFTTSILFQSNTTSTHHFVSQNTIEGEGNGSFQNCYYLENSDSDNKINVSVSKNNANGVEKLAIEDFKDLNNFTSYAYGEDISDYNNVWIYLENQSNLYPFNTNEVSLTYGRLELVSANIIATSEREQLEPVENEDGTTTYNYVYVGNQQGEMLNPYTVFSAEDFETYLSHDRKGYYRLVNNLNYSDVIANSYSYIFKGIIEGNGMNISNVEITSSDGLQSAGFIASLISENSKTKYPKQAGIMNLDLVPTTITCSNASIVGGLVGVVQNANVINVNVYSNLLTKTAVQSGNTILISGYNIVGGVVGLVKESGKIKNVASTVGSKSTYIPSEREQKVYTTGIYSDEKLSNVSYSGCVIGYANSTYGIEIEDIHSYGESAKAIGDRVGFVFGGISRGVIASNITVDIYSGMLLKAYSFAGLIIGECAGEITDVVVNGNQEDLAIFSIESYTSTAVGGVVGYMYEGELSEVYMGQSFHIKVEKNIEDTIDYVGGIVGYVNNNGTGRVIKISKTVLDADISARNYIGGIIAFAETEVALNQVAIHEHTLKQEGLLTNSYIGGFIGYNSGKVTINNSYSLASINSHVYSYSENIIANVGAILGKKVENSSSLSLKNIYTITSYSITTENIGETGKQIKYVEDDGYVTYEDKGKIEGLGYTLSDSVFEEIDETNDSVFNFIGTTKASALNYLTTNWTAYFNAEESSTIKMTLNQNEYGKSVCSWYNTKNSGTEINPNNKGKELYYGLGDVFNGDPSTLIWYTPTDPTNTGIITGLSTLVFEQELRTE